MKTKNGKRKTGNGTAWRILILAGLLLGLAGCYYNALEADYGRSVSNNIAQQVVNPEAGYSGTPAVGLSPRAGENTLEKYDKSFKSEEKKGIDLKMLSPGGY